MKTGNAEVKAHTGSTKPGFGGRERRRLSETVLIEEELIPAFFRPILYVIAAMVVAFVVWAASIELSEVAIAPGQVIPAGSIKVVQHLDGGVVAAIDVEERKLVEQGQVLLRVDGSQALADQMQILARQAGLQLRSERLQAFIEHREPVLSEFAEKYPNLVADQRAIFLNQKALRDSTLDILKSQIGQRKQRLEQLRKALASAIEHQRLTGELLVMREDLGKRRLIARTILLETQRAKVTADGEVTRINQEIALVNREITEAESRLLDTTNQLQRDASAELGTIRAEMAEVEETLQRLGARVDRLEVRSPARGYIHHLQVRTVGQVIQPGALLMEIVPAGVALEAEVRIAPRDIGYVQPGQPVNLRVSAYEYSHYGFARGKLKRISASNMIEEGGKTFFLGWVTLDKPFVGNDPKHNPIQVGMTVEAEIITGYKTLLAYIAKPIVNSLSQAFRER